MPIRTICRDNPLHGTQATDNRGLGALLANGQGRVLRTGNQRFACYADQYNHC